MKIILVISIILAIWYFVWALCRAANENGMPSIEDVQIGLDDTEAE